MTDHSLASAQFHVVRSPLWGYLMADGTNSGLMELVALLLLDRSPQPVGAARLAAAWHQAGLSGAEATAGRYLRQLDHRGLTTVHRATKGRVLTEAGQAHLLQLLKRQRQDEHGAQLWHAVNATEIADLIDLLHLRRMVETEVARMAAGRATDDELAQLAEVAADQVGAACHGRETTAGSMNFHRLVAEASHNRILIAVAQLLLDPANDPLEKALEYIALDAGTTLDQVSDHVELAAALQRRDPDEAEQIMRRHMDKLIQAVESYRDHGPH